MIASGPQDKRQVRLHDQCFAFCAGFVLRQHHTPFLLEFVRANGGVGEVVEETVQRSKNKNG
jgi:hypothetical protein